jgi:hypothetical protein
LKAKNSPLAVNSMLNILNSEEIDEVIRLASQYEEGRSLVQELNKNREVKQKAFSSATPMDIDSQF